MNIKFTNGSKVNSIPSENSLRGNRSKEVQYIDRCSCGNELDTMSELFHGLCKECHVKLSGKQSDGTVVEY